MEPFDLTESQHGPFPAASRDQLLLRSLIVRYRTELEQTYELVAARLHSSRAPSAQIRDLVFRHGLPFFAALDALEYRGRNPERVASGAVLAYSIPLVWIDIQVDGGAAELRQQESLWSATGNPWYLNLITHHGYGDIASGSGSLAAVEWTAETSATVVDAMRMDAARRWDPAQLDVDDAFIERYWNSPTSRLNGSGIARLMIGLASILADGEVTADRAEIASTLGVLRQLADELMDVVEDARGGLITLPVAYGLLDAHEAAPLGRLVRELWRRTDGRRDFDERLRELVFSGGGHTGMTEVADALLRAAVESLPHSFPRPEPIRALLVHRRYQMERAVANRLTDPPPWLSVDDLLGLP